MSVVIFVLGGVYSIGLLYAGMRIEQSRHTQDGRTQGGNT